mmetsp:Transcript_100510/g.260089  ORF Transcript_100510/g.260089 Transcript_100510/m.260089 type:complete len:256 (-) Transcript_100510:233-1000(-)
MFACCTEASSASAQQVDTISLEAAAEATGVIPKQDEEAPPIIEDLARKDAEDQVKVEEVQQQPETGEVPPKPEILDISLDKGDTMLGMALDLKAKGIHVLRIGQGAVERYNASVQDAEERKRIQPNDFIVAVNGARSNTDMVKVMKSEAILNMKVLRAVPATVTLSKAGRKLGCNLTYQEGQSIAVDITDISEGAISAYNQGVTEPMQIKNGDCIASVNGVSGSGAKIVEEILNAENLKMSFYRVELCNAVMKEQ